MPGRRRSWKRQRERGREGARRDEKQYEIRWTDHSIEVRGRRRIGKPVDVAPGPHDAQLSEVCEHPQCLGKASHSLRCEACPHIRGVLAARADACIASSTRCTACYRVAFCHPIAWDDASKYGRQTRGDRRLA